MDHIVINSITLPVQPDKGELKAYNESKIVLLQQAYKYPCKTKRFDYLEAMGVIDDLGAVRQRLIAVSKRSFTFTAITVHEGQWWLIVHKPGVHTYAVQDTTMQINS